MSVGAGGVCVWLQFSYPALQRGGRWRCGSVAIGCALWLRASARLSVRPVGWRRADCSPTVIVDTGPLSHLARCRAPMPVDVGGGG